MNPTRLYSVFNTSHRSLLVMAESSEAALSLAWTAGHIRHTDNGLKSEGRDAHEVYSPPQAGPLHDHWSVVQDAASKGFSGAVEFAEERISIGNKVIAL